MPKSDEIIYGIHAVSAVVQFQPQRISRFLISRRRDQRLKTLLAQVEAISLKVEYCTAEQLSEWVPSAAVHQGVVAVIHRVCWSESQIPQLLSQQNAPLVLILDQVQDPHNLGACLRAANGFGVACVIVPQDGAADLTAVARKVACGAAAVTPFIRVKNLARCLRQLQDQGLWLVGTDAEADCCIADIDLTGPVGIVMGGEGPGMRQLTKKHCDYLAKIDLQGSVASLNVSVAAGIALYEVRRQRC